MNEFDDSLRDEDEGLSETPFNPKDGILFKYGCSFMNRESEIASFEEHLGFALPEDFLDLIGDWCEAGFNGWYRVKKGSFGSIVWNHLLLMRLPIAVDYELEKLPGREDVPTRITTRLLEQNPSLFYPSPGKMAYFPFGTASCFKPDNSGTDGFLVFDRQNQNKVRFISDDEPCHVEIADSFSEMMMNSVFESFG